MTEASRPAPELARQISAFARSLVVAVRNRLLYPPDHPNVLSALERWQSALEEAGGGLGLSLGVTPDTLLIEGVGELAAEGPVSEAAGLLHERDVLSIGFGGAVPAEALQALLDVLTRDPDSLRAQGGPARVWSSRGHAGITLSQVDYQAVLQDREAPATRRDDIWRAIVRSILDRRSVFDEVAQRRLLEIAGDPDAIGELTGDVIAPMCTPGGAPMLTTQAAVVLAAYRHLVNIVSVVDPDRVDEVMRNLAAATAPLNPQVVMQLFTAGRDTEEAQPGGPSGTELVSGLAAAFDDMKVAQLLAAALAADGHATQRLAQVFDTIAPDEPRKRRVLSLTRSLLDQSAFGELDQFRTVWTSMEELLLGYNEAPFVSEEYRAALDGAGAQAEAMAAEVPPETGEWVATLAHDNVRSLSVRLMIDLLRLESDRERAGELVRDMAGLAEDLLLAGDYGHFREVVAALALDARNGGPGHHASRGALDQLARGSAMREAVALLGELLPADFQAFEEACAALGPGIAELLLPLLAEDAPTPAQQRGESLLLWHGAAAVPYLDPLANDQRWHARRNAARLLGRLGSPAGVPLLQPLLRMSDLRVVQAAASALTRIDDPSAARAIHTVLRSANGQARRVVIDALVAQRDRRVVPVLARILDESEPLGRDHAIGLETLAALALMADDRATAPAVRAMYRHRWFARRRRRALKQAAVETLVKVGTGEARAALEEAAGKGDRMLRRIARQALGGMRVRPET